MKRREFLSLSAFSAIAAGIRGKRASNQAFPFAGADKPLTRANASSALELPDPFGSGHFGKWITDQFGLPAYHYTCEQDTDATARTPVHKEWRSPTDHTHQIGNDRLVAAASNYGYVQVRQDEGSPKFLNDFSPELGRYGGGIGFLTDGTSVLSTYYPGNSESFDRIFGEGYFRKTVRRRGLEADQVLFAPFGDDPVLISRVTIANKSAAPATLRWIEYWGCNAYQFSYRRLMESGVYGGMKRAPELRRQLESRFAHDFKKAPGGTGLVESKRYLGPDPNEVQSWARVQAALKSRPNTFFGGAIPDLAPGSSFEDLAPPSTFLVSLDGPVAGMATNSSRFLGAGGPLRPDGIQQRLGQDSSAENRQPALILERELALAPGESKTIHFMYGYLPEGFELGSLQSKYGRDPRGAWARSSAQWKTEGLRFAAPSAPWVERETAWHSYYLRSDLTYDAFFGEHILSQGHIYQYLMGFQGAARDPLQHALPFVFTRPEIVKEIIRYTLKETQSDGSIPYGIVGSGVPMPVAYRPSDQELWLLWLASEYVLGTRDTEFLTQRIPAYPRHEAHSSDPTVAQLLGKCFTHLSEIVGTGEHGLMRVSNGDWNDSLVVGNISPSLHDEIRVKGESVLNAAMACYVLDYYSRLLSYTGNREKAAEAKAKAEAQRQAVRSQWTGQWFKRAWLGSKLGWVGEKEIWLEPQPWAIIGGAATPEQSQTLVQELNRLVRAPSPIGAMLHAQALTQMGLPPGTLTNGGIWPSINGTLIWALCQIDPALGWDEWKKNSLARHADQYPNIWYGIWSGPDSYNSILSRHPGETMFAEPGSGQYDFGLNWTDFPVMNMHPHAWPIYSAAKLIGVDFNETGLALSALLPLEEYEFTSRLVGLRKSAGKLSGWYAPSRRGQWEISIRLAELDVARLKALTVNGRAQKLSTREAGVVRFTGLTSPSHPLRWSLA